MRKLRLPVRLYVIATVALAALVLGLSALAPDLRGSPDPLLLAGLLLVATAAQVQVVHVSVKRKISVGDTALFAAVLLVTPPAALAIAAISTLAGLRVATKQPLYNLLFNASGTVLTAAAAAWVLRALSPAGLLEEPLAIAASAVAFYLVKTLLTDGAIALQLRRDPVRGWWAAHRGDLTYHGALYLLGVLAAISAREQVWTLALFLVPVALVLIALRETTRLRRRTKDAIVELADMIDRRDRYTYGHSQRVAEHASKVARRLRLSAERVDLITEAARMHDIGKVSVPDRILKKPAALDAHEWSEMRDHCEASHRFLASLPDFADGAELVLSHHERVDGSGYPRRLCGDELSLEASIIAVCDAFDAMTSDRVYRPALPWGAVLSELRGGRGSQWHERAVDALLELVQESTIVPHSVPLVAAVGAD